MTTDDGNSPANPAIMGVGGKFRAAATTYTNEDAVMFQMAINGELKTVRSTPLLSGDIVVGRAKGAYAFDASAKTVTLTGLDTLNLEDITSIINVTDNIVIYDINDPGKGGSISSNVVTLTFDTTGMADADSLKVIINDGQNYIDWSLSAIKTSPQSNAPMLATSPEAYTTLAPDDTTYDEGSVIDTRAYKSILVHYSKTASTDDASVLKVISLTAADSATDYQQTSSSTVAGVSTVNAHTYERAKDALVETISIDTKGANFMRLDLKKKTDDGDDSTWTIFITKVPR